MNITYNSRSRLAIIWVFLNKDGEPKPLMIIHTELKAQQPKMSINMITVSTCCVKQNVDGLENINLADKELLVNKFKYYGNCKEQ